MSEAVEGDDGWDQTQQQHGEGQEDGGNHEQQQQPEAAYGDGDHQEYSQEQQQQMEQHQQYGGEGEGEMVGEDGILDLDGDGQQTRMGDEEGVLLMRFCPHDSSMLYPQEDKRTRTLRHACRLCRYSEESHTALIYRNRLKKEVVNALQNIPSSVSDDPTLPRSHNTSCDVCGHNEAVFFQSDTSDIRADSLALIFVCCNCDHKWVG